MTRENTTLKRAKSEVKRHMDDRGLGDFFQHLEFRNEVQPDGNTCKVLFAAHNQLASGRHWSDVVRRFRNLDRHRLEEQIRLAVKEHQLVSRLLDLSGVAGDDAEGF